MKAVFQNTILSLLCVASVVLAAPTQSFSYPAPSENQQIHAVMEVNTIQHQVITASCPKETVPTIADGSIRFTCY